jgi:hypothetical protein
MFTDQRNSGRPAAFNFVIDSTAQNRAVGYECAVRGLLRQGLGEASAGLAHRL